MEKKKSDFLKLVSVGNIIAFMFNDKVKSGMVIEIDKSSKQFTIRTKNGSIYFVPFANFIWLKNGSNWPVGIANALRYDKNTHTKPNQFNTTQPSKTKNM